MDVADEVYELQERRVGWLRRLLRWAGSGLLMVVTLGDSTMAPGTRVFRVVDKRTGRAVGDIGEDVGAGYDLGDLLRTELRTTSPEAFAQRWLQTAP